MKLLDLLSLSRVAFLLLLSLLSIVQASAANFECKTALEAVGKQSSATQWVDLSLYPPIVSDNIKLIKSDSFECGDCHFRFFAHMQALASLNYNGKMRQMFDWSLASPLSPRALLQRSSRELKNEINRAHFQIISHPVHLRLLVKLNGQLIGFFKKEGDPSFLALTNVVNSKGELILAMGRVYRPSMNFYDIIQADIWTPDYGPSKINEVDLARIELKENSFLLNEYAFYNTYLIEILFGGAVFNFNDPRENEAIIWAEILRLIDKARAKSESL